MSEAGKRLSILLGKARPKGDRWHGLIGNFDGVIDVPNKPGWKYVRIPKAGTGDYELGEFPELNVAGTEYNSPVLIEYDPLTAQRVIAGGDQQAAAAIGVTPGAPDPGAYSLPKHAPLHQAGGGDPVTVSPLQISNLQLSPSATAKHVTLGAGLGVAAGTLVLKAADTDVDLTSYFPASGYKLVWITMTSAGAAAVVDPACTSFASLTLPTTINYVIGLVRLRAFQPITLLDIVDVRREWGGLVGWDVAGQGARHASDISAAALLRHLAAPTAAGNVMLDDSAKWNSVDAAGHVPFAPTACGDLIVANSTPVWSRLAKGTQYQVLTGGATDPAWGAVNLAQATAITGNLPLANLAVGPAEGRFIRAGANPFTPEWSTLKLPNAATQGDLLCASGADVVGVVAAGATAGHVLTSAGAGAAPTWQANPAAGWSLTGNAGTTPGTNFVGTTDAQPLAIVVNNSEVARFLNTPYHPQLHIVGGAWNTRNYTAGITFGSALNYIKAQYAGGITIGSYNGPNDPISFAFSDIVKFSVAYNGILSHFYDASNYWTATVSAAGAVTFAATGASAGFVFAPAVTFSSDVTLTTAKYIGLGASAGRLTFTDATPDTAVFSDCSVGIGTSSPGTYGVFECHQPTGVGTGVMTVGIADTTSQAAGVGGGLKFAGAYTGTTLTSAAIIRAEKVNSTDGNYGFNLAFYTRPHGGAMALGMLLDSTKALTVACAFGCNGATAQAAAHYSAGGSDADKIAHILAALVANGIMYAVA